MLQRLPLAILVCAYAALCGCAAFKENAIPVYAYEWKQVAESSAGLSKLKKARIQPRAVSGERYKKYNEAYLEQEEN